MSLYHERRTSDATLEWESLPEVGADRRPRRLNTWGKRWIAIIVMLVSLWTGVVLIAGALS